MMTFEATITGGTANPSNITQLLTPPAPAGDSGCRGGAPAAPPPCGQKRWLRASTGSPAATSRLPSSSRITSSCSKVGRATRAVRPLSLRPRGPFPTSRSVCGQLASALRSRKRAGAVCGRRHHHHHPQEQQEPISEKALGAPRTLVGDPLGKSTRKPKVESAGSKRVLKDDTHTIELYHVENLAHSDGMLVGYLAEGEDSLHGGLQHSRAGPARQPGHRCAGAERRSPEARLRSSRPGARAEPGSAANPRRSPVARQGMQ